MYKQITLIAAGLALLCSCATNAKPNKDPNAAFVNSTANYGTMNFNCSSNTRVSLTFLDKKKAKARLTVRTVGDDKRANLLNFIVDYFPEPLNVIYQNTAEGVNFIDQKHKDISVTFPLAKKSMMVICTRR